MILLKNPCLPAPWICRRVLLDKDRLFGKEKGIKEIYENEKGSFRADTVGINLCD